MNTLFSTFHVTLMLQQIRCSEKVVHSRDVNCAATAFRAVRFWKFFTACQPRRVTFKNFKPRQRRVLRGRSSKMMNLCKT